jgi:predicted anti-sigma-YlaC factor YlaD
MTSIDCHRLRPVLVDLAVGTLAYEQAEVVLAHVQACASCRGDLAAMRGVATELRQPGAATPPDEFWQEQRTGIMRRIGVEPSVERRPTRRWAIAGALATAALALLLVRGHFHTHTPAAAHSVDRLDDETLLHLDDLLPALVPAGTLDDADADAVAANDAADAAVAWPGEEPDL